jgi:hypothetical protein
MRHLGLKRLGWAMNARPFFIGSSTGRVRMRYKGTDVHEASS